MAIMSLVTLFGLIDIPKILMGLMNGVTLRYLERFVIIFIDNILVYLNNKDNYGKCLRMVLHVNDL